MDYQQQQGPAPHYATEQPPTYFAPPSHLVWAILATICCCLPTGIVAIVYAAQVGPKVATGDLQGAQASSKNALMWCWISVGLAILTNVPIILYMLITGAGVR